MLENGELYSSWCAVYSEIVENIANQNGSGKEFGSLVTLLQDFDKNLQDYENDENREALKQLNEKITALMELFSEKHLNECMRSLQSIQNKITRNLSPEAAIATISLPAEILLNIASHLPLRGLKSLSSSCQFFNQHEKIWKKIAEKGTEIKLVSGGENCSFVLLQNGQLFGFGANDNGQLGLGHTDSQSTPQLIPLPLIARPRQISAGSGHSLILCDDGSVYSIGCNGYGQLGLGHTDSQSTPQLIRMPRGASPCQISAGSWHSLILCDDGSVYSFGYNLSGQLGLGLGDGNKQSTPQLISMPRGARPCQISAGSRHSLILCEDGSVYSFGADFSGQLGLGLGLGYRNKQSTPQFIPMPLEARPCQVFAGADHSFILCENGSVYGFGANAKGQLGLGHNTKRSTPQLIPMPTGIRPCQVFVGADHSFILCDDESVYGFGDNGCGQLGLGHRDDQSTPQFIPMPVEVRPCQISAGFSHSLILCDDGSAYGFGDNECGQLGLGHENNQLAPQLIFFPLIESQENMEEKNTSCVR